MKKTVFNASVIAVALVAGVCSFTTMLEGRALSKQEKIMLHGLADTCKGCFFNEGCKSAQPIPTEPTPRGAVIICDAKPSRTAQWSQTQEVTHLTQRFTCTGKLYKCLQDENGVWGWVLHATGPAVVCGERSECNDQEGGWGETGDGTIVDQREDYREQCDKEKPPPPNE